MGRGKVGAVPEGTERQASKQDAAMRGAIL